MLALGLSLGVVSFGSAGLSAYAANGFDPKFVADFTADGDYFRVAGNDATFSDAFTSDSEAGGLVVQRDSSGNAVWGAHNLWPHSDDLESGIVSDRDATVSGNTITATAQAGIQSPSCRTNFTFPVAAVFTVSIDCTDFAGQAAYAFIDFTAFTSGTAVVVDMSDGTVTTDETPDNNATTEAISDGYRVTFSIDASAFGDLAGVVDLGLSERSDAILRITDPTTADKGTFSKIHVYRSDLGGMADVPADERDASSLNKYVPTTTAARYLLRRGHYDYDGSSYNRTCLHEPEGATNELDYSRDFSQWSDASTPADLAQNTTGFDGVANSAYTLTDNGGSLAASKALSVTVPDDSNPAVVTAFVGKDASPAVYPIVGAQFQGGTAVLARYLVDPSDGSTVTVDAGTAVYVENWSDDFWRVSVVLTNNGTGNTSCRALLYPAWNDDGTATIDGSVTGSTAFDQVDLVLNASIPSSPIITAGAAVTRSADTMKGKAASLPYSSTAISMAVKGRYQVPSGKAGFLDWYQGSGSRFLIQKLASSVRALATSGGTNAVSSGPSLTAGVEQPVAVSARWVGGSAVQYAEGGVAATADTTSVPAIAPLSDDDLIVSATTSAIAEVVNGQIDTVRLWDEDVETAGIEESTA